MPTLEQALYDHELIVLRVLGEWMDLDLLAADKKSCVAALAEAFGQVNLELETQYLPPEEAAAFQALLAAGGRLPVATFSRAHGDVRLMGPGALEREEPWYDPISPAEALWYRGFIYRNFQETADGLVEFFYLPDEFLAQFPTEAAQPEPVVVPTVTPVPEPTNYDHAPRDAVDDLTTLLCLVQNEPLPLACYEAVAPYLRRPEQARFTMLLALALDGHLLRETELGLRPARPAADWLKYDRDRQLQQLARSWQICRFNELRHLPALQCEGSGWANDPRLARQTLKEYLPQHTEWVPLAELVAAIKKSQPDFQRPDGDYDSWYIKDVDSGAFLRGFAHWDKVEGRLLQFLLQGPLFWLGLVDVGPDAFRLTATGLAWHQGQKLPAGREQNTPLVVNNDGVLEAAAGTDRHTRFQASRVADTLPFATDAPYRYLLTPRSLQRAEEQGISPKRLLDFLERSSSAAVPASVKRAIERWTENGSEARLQRTVVLRVKDAEILEKLRANPKTRPFLGESLGDFAVLVKEGQWEELCLATTQLGLFIDGF